MIRNCSPIVLFLLLILFMGVSSVFGETITFDDLDVQWSNNQSIYDGYAGFSWVNFKAMYPTYYYNEQYMSGYLAGMVSPGFIAWNQDQMPAELRSDTPFNFISTYLTAAWLENLQIDVEGFYGSELLYSQTVYVSPYAPTLFYFNYDGVDRVRFTPSATTDYSLYSNNGSGTFFVMDNLEFSIDEVNGSVIEIDIKPGSAENPINLKSRGRIPVALLSSASFDAATVDPDTLKFGPMGNEASAVKCVLEDVNNDTWIDMICHFKTQEANFICGDTEGLLEGSTIEGEAAIQASDTVRIVPCNKLGDLP